MAGEGGAAVLQVLVQNLIDLSTIEISLIRGLKKEAQKLTLNLRTIQKFLNDAETRSIPTGDVKIWLQRLENAAFEADNVLDAFNYHLLSRKLNKGKLFHVHRAASKELEDQGDALSKVDNFSLQRVHDLDQAFFIKFMASTVIIRGAHSSRSCPSWQRVVDSVYLSIQSISSLGSKNMNN